MADTPFATDAPSYPCLMCGAETGQYCTTQCQNMNRKFGKLGAPAQRCTCGAPVDGVHARGCLTQYGKDPNKAKR